MPINCGYVNKFCTNEKKDKGGSKKIEGKTEQNRTTKEEEEEEEEEEERERGS